MTAFLEVWRPSGRELVLLEGPRVTVGRGDGNDVALPSDRTASGVHAKLEQIADGWCVQDLGSRNGTYVGGERLTSTRALRDGDELAVGQTKLVFLSSDGTTLTQTQAADDDPGAPPEITAREREVLVALCTPLRTGDAYTEPAAARDVAKALFVSEAAVRQHLAQLYRKFAIAEGGGSRRGRLANEALRRGVVARADREGQQA